MATVSQSAFFPRVKNLHTRKTSNGSNFGWLIRQMSINQKSGRQTFRRRFVSGSLFVSPCPPECYLQSETKIEPHLRLFLSENAIKVKIVDKMMQSAYLCVISYVKHKKVLFLAVFTRPLLVTPQASSGATTYKIYLILLRRWKAFHLRQNPFQILHISKTLGRG